jgi:cell division protein FtsN
MTLKKAYSGSTNPGQSPWNSGRCLLIILLFFMMSPVPLIAQEDPDYDEISVYIKIPYIGVGEIDAVIRGAEIWLPVTNLFDFLKIRNVPTTDLDQITGFFISPEATYTIDKPGNRIVYGDKTFTLDEGDLIRSETNLYLKSQWYGKIFGLDCNFSFRDLTVTVDTKLELPGIREMKLEEMRVNLTRLKGDIKVDTTVARTYPGFRFGMADWSVYATEQIGGPSQARLNLALGSVIAGGEATAVLNYYSGTPFTEKQQQYLWRHVNNDRSLVRQVMAGKIISNATASIYDPVVGIQLTNTPTTFRQSFGSYNLTDRTEPGWTVELYVNNVLVDYVKADASGFFTFEVPLVYGNTQVRLKFYGPWGEERVREQNISIPYNFLPHKEFEYIVSAGVVEDSLWSRFSKVSVSYGATRFLTLGGGVEYLSSVSTGPVMPFVNASARLANNLLLSGEYAYGVRARGTLTYRLPSNIQFDLNYTRYDRDQKAINYNYLEERRASLSLPLRIKKFSAYSRLSYYKIVLPLSDYTTAEWMFATPIMGVNTNLTTYGIFTDNTDPYIYSNLSLSVRLPADFLLMPQVQYSYTGNEFLSAKLAVEKRLFKNGYANISYEQNFVNNLKMGEIGFRYDFTFAQTGVSARQSNKQTTLVEYARGSLINDSKTNYLKADNRTNVGRAGISLQAFIDLNANGLRDAGEPKAYGLNVHSNGGRIERSDKDSTIHIIGLEPYVKYFLEFDESSFESISWRIDKKSVAVITDANMLKLIEVPVSIKGEATGTVMLEEWGSVAGLGRIIVNFYNSANVLTARALTEDDGYFSYFGFAPGSYYARVDTSQLRKLNMTSTPDSVPFGIMTNMEGDYVEGLDFTLRRTAVRQDSITAPAAAPAAPIAPVAVPVVSVGPSVKKDTSYLVVHEVTRELVTITEDYYAVQFGAFRNKLYAEIMKKKVVGVLDKNVELFEEDGFWKVRITGFDDRDDLNKYIPIINGQGITEIWVITNKAVRSDWLTKEREDSLAMVKETIEAQAVPVIISGTTIQLGAFSSEEETSSMTDRLLAAAEKLVTVRQEEGVYKVQITGFADTNEVRDFIPLLKKHGFTDILVIHESETVLAPVPQDIQISPEQPAQVEVPELPEKPVEIVVEKPAEPEIIIEETLSTEPIFILHAGSYYKLAQAEKAKRKIESKLKRPVEIITEWDSYKVIITGFYTREETYPYYPELAGMGFTDIFVYEKPLIDRR